MVATGGAILFLRFPDALIHPQLFAEGGTHFFKEAYELRSLSLVKPYAGYLHLVPRLIAYVDSHFDPRWAPAVYNFSAFLAEILVLSLLASERVNLPLKPALVLGLALVPHAGETINSFINVNWWLALILILILVSRDATNAKERLFDWTAAALSGLTGPFSTCLCCLFVVRAWLRRSPESWAVAFLVTVAASIQGCFLFANSDHAIHRGWGGARESVAIFSARLFGTYWAGYGLGIISPNAGWIALGVLLTALGAFLAFRHGAYAYERRMLASALVCLLTPVWFKFGKDLAILSGVTNGDRYFFLPHVLWGWTLVVALAAQKGWGRWLVASAAVAALAANLNYLQQPALPRLPWDKYAPSIRDGKAVSIPINPPGWVIRFPGRDRRLPLEPSPAAQSEGPH